MATREATINVNIGDLPQIKEMLAEAAAELEAAHAEIERLRTDLRTVHEPPRWYRIHPTHMKGWEAFGVVGPDRSDPPTVRRLGELPKPLKSDLGTEKWGPGEVKLGVGGIELITSGDHPAGAYLYVLGTEGVDVERRWRLVADLWDEIGGRLWPTSR